MSSPIDLLFEEIFEYKPKKAGEAYEILAAAVTKLLGKGSQVKHDEKMRGTFSETLYQIDVLLEQQSKKEMGEAKDYTVKGAKVGRADLQKLGGALVDLPDIDGGIFFSATDYTKPAKKYAEASQKIFGKEIKLFNLKPSTELDEQGRIMIITIEMHILLPIYKKAKFTPLFSDSGQVEITRLIESGQLEQGGMKLSIEEIYDDNRNVITTVKELTSNNFGGNSSFNAKGTFYLKGRYISISGFLIEILGITYDIPFSETIETIEIHSQGKAKLLLKDQFGHIDKLITDDELRNIIKEININ
ncbi:restriction endonuclease (plasmid) [Niallia sp. XMNu-256]|uniref:restriction endonuclease n=1 Tax=Niallia sp. XMNu-256 TaxID=3082444 RepID=UPI0030CFA4CC